MKDAFIYIGVLIALGIVFWKRNEIADVAIKLTGNLTRGEFIDIFGPYAKATKSTGLFPSVAMAQAILESGNGNSSLTREAFNLFGIKADSSWTGPFVTKQTREVIDGKTVYVNAKFRAYENPGESFVDRGNFLRQFSRYRNAGVFTAPTPEAQAIALQNAGYATDPVYAELLIKLINQNNLKKFDV